MRLIQLNHPEHGRRVAMIDGPALRLIERYESIYALACEAIVERASLIELTQANIASRSIDYEQVHDGSSTWRVLPAFDHPIDPARCHVSGTGLTHKVSALNRQAMHKQSPDELTDSMRMFQWGMEGGKPDAGKIGVQPEWFYKGSGSILRGHNEPLDVPAHADDGGDEPEIAGCYLIDAEGKPVRVGMAQGNEFADHVMERKNYLYLAPSKLRCCSIGPELVIDPAFDDLHGKAYVRRGSETIWSGTMATGEANMSHSLANLEHHHFKHADHCRPGDVHVHYVGADAFSFGDGVSLQDGDVMEIAFPGFGRPLRNPVRIDRGNQPLMAARPIHDRR